MFNSNASTNSEYLLRKQKAMELRKMGIEPWPEFKPVSKENSAQLCDKARLLAQGTESEEHYQFCGRIMTRREHGKTTFLVLQDFYGSIQCYFKLDLIGNHEFDIISKLIDIGDIIWVSGTLFLTKTNEPTIKVSEWSLASKCLHTLAEKYHGLTNVEQRYRQRYLDLICNRPSLEKFKKRFAIISQIRSFFAKNEFVEAETPMLHSIAGGAVARPFKTHHNAYGMDLFLRIAPELFLKRLSVAGFSRVFEINRNFRNEGVSTRHNPEFTMLEFYMAHGDYKVGMDFTEKIFQEAISAVGANKIIEFGPHQVDFSKPFERLTVKEAVMKYGNVTSDELSEKNINKLISSLKMEISLEATYGHKLFALFEELAEKKIVQPTFVIGYPVEVSPLAKRDPYDETITARFELFICGMEFANGFTELNDPIDQAKRFHEQLTNREDSGVEAHEFDQDFITALEYGLVPTVGVGIGIDRLVMLMTNTETIKDVILFPTMKNKVD